MTFARPTWRRNADSPEPSEERGGDYCDQMGPWVWRTSNLIEKGEWFSSYAPMSAELRLLAACALTGSAAPRGLRAIVTRRQEPFYEFLAAQIGVERAALDHLARNRLAPAPRDGHATDCARARALLEEMMRGVTCGGEMPLVREIEREALAAGLTKRSLRWARVDLGLCAYPVGVELREWGLYPGPPAARPEEHAPEPQTVGMIDGWWA